MRYGTSAATSSARVCVVGTTNKQAARGRGGGFGAEDKLYILQEGVRPAAARLALGVEMEGWKLNRACGLCSLALEPGPVQYQLARDSVVGRALRAEKPNLNMKFFE